MSPPDRKAPCPCGSGKRYKHCCGANAPAPSLAGAPLPSRAQARAAFLHAHRAHGQGRLAEAAAGYRAALAADPDHADALHYLGMLNYASGQLEQAQAMVSRSLTLKPRDADFWANAALVEQAAGRPDAAIAAYRSALQLAPGEAQRYTLLGSLLLQHGHVDAAIETLGTATRLAPRDAQAWLLLGNARLRETPRDYPAAQAALERALALDPRHVEIHVSLSTAYAMTRQMDRARSILEDALRVNPDNAKIWANLGMFWISRNDADQAIHCLEKAVALQPDALDAHYDLGQMLKTRGDFDAACRHFEYILERDPGHLKALAQHVDQARFEHRDAAALRAAEARAAAAAPGTAGRVELHFALGRALDRLRDADAAFTHFAHGNALKAVDEPFDAAAYHAEVSQRMARFDSAGLAALQRWANRSTRPIFIVGLPRSGTTLTEHILASHPAVAGGGEREFWPYLDRALAADGWTDSLAALPQAVDDYLAELEQVKDAAGTRHVIDKMPDNFKRVGMLHALFPEARFIHVRRHPIDTCLSIFFQNFSGHGYARTLPTLAAYCRDYQRLMAHWRTLLPADRLFEFDYEALVADQEGVSRALVAFCGLDWDDACLDFQANARAVRTASLWQVRQKLYTSSVARWKAYAAHLGPLLALDPAAPVTPAGGQ